MDKLTIKTDNIVLRLNTGSIVVSGGKIESVNGKTDSDVVLDAADVGAEPLGSVQQAKDEIQPQIESLSENKLDKVDYVQHFLGVFPSKAALDAAHPTARPGDSADIDSGSGFDVMRAIWDDSDHKWVVREVGNASNTDQVPEGNTNLYFKSARVLATVLSGLNPTNSVITAADTIVQGFSKAQGQISNIINNFAANVRNTILTGIVFTDKSKATSTDSIEKAIGKLQAQLNDVAAPVWRNAKDIGTIHANINNSWTLIEFAKIDGMLWIRGWVYGAISPSVPWVTLADPNWYLNAPLTPTSGNSIPFSFLGVQQATGGPLIHHQFFGAQSSFYGLSLNIVSSFTDKYVFINPTCLGELVNK